MPLSRFQPFHHTPQILLPVDALGQLLRGTRFSEQRLCLLFRSVVAHQIRRDPKQIILLMLFAHIRTELGAKKPEIALLQKIVCERWVRQYPTQIPPQGRGGAVGPDLTPIHKMAAKDLLTAIREPSKEIAPAFLQWMYTMRDGSMVVGIDLFEDNKAKMTLVDATGKRTQYPRDQVVKAQALPVSMMPPGLDYQMTEQELRDLLAFLRERRD